MMPERRRGATLARQTLQFLPGVAAPPVFAFLTLIVFTRLLPPDAFGRYAIAIASVELARAALLNWLRVGYLRYHSIAEGEGRLAALDRTVWIALLVALLAAVLGGSAVVAVLPLAPELRVVLWCGLGLLVARSLVFQALMPLHATAQTLRYSSYLACDAALGFLLALLIHQYLLGSELAVVAGLATGSLLVFAALVRSGSGSFTAGGIDTGYLRSLAVYGAPLSLSMILSFVVASSDRYMIAYYLDETATGLYSASYALGDRAISSIFMLVSMAGLPSALKAFDRDGAPAADRSLRGSFALVTAVGIPATIGLVMLAGPIGELALGAAFREPAEMLIPWVAVATFLAGLKTFYLDHAFHIARRTGLQVFAIAPAAILNILLNVLLIPRYGMVGAAWSTLAAMAGAALASWLLGRRSFPVPLPLAPVARVAAASLPMVALIVVLGPTETTGRLLLVIGLAIACYGGGCIVFNVAGLRSALARRGA